MKTRDLIFIALFIALSIAGAFIKIPLPFLSVTFQLFFALLAGIILGPLKGAIAMALYMLLGLFGIPIFSQGGGIGYVFQPSFGFILGFIFGALISGFTYIKLKVNPYFKTLISFVAGAIPVYIIGIIYMFIIFKFYTGNTTSTILAISVSMLPYLAKDIILGILVSTLGKFIPQLKKLTTND